MSLIANQNDVSSSAPAENRFSPPNQLATMQTSHEAHASDGKDPGKFGNDTETELLKYSKNLETKKRNEGNSIHLNAPQKNMNSEPQTVRIIENSVSPIENNDSQPPGAPGQAGRTFSHLVISSSDEEEGEINSNIGNIEKKIEAPAQKDGICAIPPVLYADMKDFIKSLKPTKFSKIENAATKLVHKFKKTLPCPKCETVHGHTPQGGQSNQFGGTAPHNKCRSSVPQLLMMLPHDLICAIGKSHRDFDIKDASLFTAWISSSKAAHKEAILKKLRHEMQIDNDDFEADEEETEDEIELDYEMKESQEEKSIEQLEKLKINDETPINNLEKVTSYSDSEFRAVITEELLGMRKRLKTLEEENLRLRQENSVLRKYYTNSSTATIKEINSQLPSSTTSLKPSYLETVKIATQNITRPVIAKRTRQEVGATVEQTPKSRPQVELSLFTSSVSAGSKPQEQSKLVFVYFKGLVRRPMSEYRALFDQIGFGGYKARDILFLSQDFLQILTYENCVDELVEKIRLNFPSAKHVEDADPTDPKNYEEHGNLSKEFLRAQYFISMEGSVQRFRKIVTERPFLTRTLHFLEKVVQTKNVKYEKAPAKSKIFLMNSFMVLDKLQDSVKNASASLPEQLSNAMETVPVHNDNEASAQVSMETSQ